MRFHNIDGILVWAFRGRGHGAKISSIYKFKGKDRGDPTPPRRPNNSGIETMWDRLAQQGMIKSYVARLSPDMANHILAQYGAGRERIVAQNKLVGIVIPRMKQGIPVSLYNNKFRHVIYELVARFYGKPVELEDISDHFNIDIFLVGSRWAQVSEILSAIRERAVEHTEQHYVDSGLVVRE